MTTAKLNKKIIEFVFRDLARVSLTHPSQSDYSLPGFYFDKEEAEDAQQAPRAIINLLKSRYDRGEHYSLDEIDRFVQKEAWSRSFGISRALIQLDLAFGQSPKRHIQECREAIDVLEKMGKSEADWYKRFLKELLGSCDYKDINSDNKWPSNYQKLFLYLLIN